MAPGDGAPGVVASQPVSARRRFNSVSGHQPQQQPTATRYRLAHDSYCRVGRWYERSTVPRPPLQQPEAAGLGDRCRSGGRVELGENVGHVPVHGVLADEEPLPDRVIVETGRVSRRISTSRGVKPFLASGPDDTAAGQVVKASSTVRARASSRLAPRGVRSSMARRTSSRAVSGRPSAPMRRARSTRARPVSKGAPLSLNRSTASSRCFRADFRSSDRAARRPAARLANARSGPVRASLAMEWSSATAWAGFVGTVLLQAGADQELQRRRAFGPVAGGQPPEVPFREVGTGLEIAAIEDHAGAPERSQRMGPTALEQGHGFVELALAPA